MWSYYGAKTNIIDHYPGPRYDKIIEPFAGTARYALKHFDREVLLVDKYEVIVKIWKWLQLCSPGDIHGLPRFKAGDNINDHKYNCEEERLLVGFLIGFGFRSPRDIATPRLRHRPNHMNVRIKFIASQLFKIKHWEIVHGDYQDIPNEPATWFIDPPYQHGGNYYIVSGRHLDYHNNLSPWTRERQGQIIVCENMKADWLPFKPMVAQDVLSGKNYEAIWCNFPTAFDNEQLNLFESKSE